MPRLSASNDAGQCKKGGHWNCILAGRLNFVLCNCLLFLCERQLHEVYFLEAGESADMKPPWLTSLHLIACAGFQMMQAKMTGASDRLDCLDQDLIMGTSCSSNHKGRAYGFCVTVPSQPDCDGVCSHPRGDATLQPEYRLSARQQTLEGLTLLRLFSELQGWETGEAWGKIIWAIAEGRQANKIPMQPQQRVRSLLAMIGSDFCMLKPELPPVCICESMQKPLRCWCQWDCFWPK